MVCYSSGLWSFIMMENNPEHFEGWRSSEDILESKQESCTTLLENWMCMNCCGICVCFFFLESWQLFIELTDSRTDRIGKWKVLNYFTILKRDIWVSGDYHQLSSEYHLRVFSQLSSEYHIWEVFFFSRVATQVSVEYCTWKLFICYAS